MKCPRCNRQVRDRGITIQGLVYGPLCASVVSRRQRVRESFGSSKLTEHVCKISGMVYLARAESEAICPPTMCAHCRFNTPSFMSADSCALEIQNREMESL